jgi:rubrerythrin
MSKEIKKMRQDSSVRKGKVNEIYEKEIYDITAWRCEACGRIDYGYETSEGCPYCFYPDNAFKISTAA